MTICLEFKDVTVFGRDTSRLKHINLTINDGEKVALLGRSGSGKSTLISVANGTQSIDKGEVKWINQNIYELKPRTKIEISTLWQDLRLIEDLSVLQNINMGLLGRKNFFWAIRNLAGLTGLNECIPYLKALELPTYISGSKVRNISGGQKQRVAIARALYQNALILLADEPLSNLDPALSRRVLQILLKKLPKRGVTIPETSLISLHRPDLIESFTRVIGLKEGEIILDKLNNNLEISEIENLYEKPK